MRVLWLVFHLQTIWSFCFFLEIIFLLVHRRPEIIIINAFPDPRRLVKYRGFAQMAVLSAPIGYRSLELKRQHF
jgi:hypothetical protein